MGKGTIGVAALLALSAWAAPGKAGIARTELYVASPLERIVSGEVPKSAASSAALVAARGEREAFFVVLRGAQVAVEPVHAAPLRLVQGAAAIDPGRVQIYRALWVDSGGGAVPDALVPLDAPAEVIGARPSRAGEDLPLYVELSVPADAAPGEYRGTLELRIGAETLRVPVQLTVLAATLPRRASLPTVFDFSGREAALGSGARLDAQGLAGLVDDYALTALADRVTLVGGTGKAPGFQVTPGDGRLELDFAQFDREVGRWMDGVPSLEGAAASAITLRVPRGLRDVDRLKYTLAFERHLEQRGWADRLVAFADHPPVTGPLVPEALSARTVEECALAECLGGTRGARRWWTLPSGGKGISLGLGAAPEALRAIGWLAWSGGARGLRYRGAVQGFGAALWNGTAPAGALFYPLKERPGTTPRVVESLRLKLLRDGLEDYELLRLATRAGHAGLVGEWLTRIAAAPGRICRDPAEWNRARRALVEAAANSPARSSVQPPAQEAGR